MGGAEEGIEKRTSDGVKKGFARHVEMEEDSPEPWTGKHVELVGSRYYKNIYSLSVEKDSRRIFYWRGCDSARRWIISSVLQTLFAEVSRKID